MNTLKNFYDQFDRIPREGKMDLYVNKESGIGIGEPWFINEATLWTIGVRVENPFILSDDKGDFVGADGVERIYFNTLEEKTQALKETRQEMIVKKLCSATTQGLFTQKTVEDNFHFLIDECVNRGW